MFDFNMDTEIGLRLLLSFAIGSVIGLEREYRSKAAGLRTMIVICLGSTIFTEISMSFGGSSPDRIAANIITGIGFLGAGVIFKDGLTVTGITTATTIWIAAALGMAVGAGEYFIALVGSAVVLVVLTAFEHVKLWIIRMHQARIYKITFRDDAIRHASILEEKIKVLNLGFRQERLMRNDDKLILVYEIFGKENKLHDLNLYLQQQPEIKSFEY